MLLAGGLRRARALAALILMWLFPNTMAPLAVTIGASLTMAKSLMAPRPLLASDLRASVPVSSGPLRCSITLLDGWHLQTPLLRAIMTCLFLFSPTPGLEAAGAMELRPLDKLAYIPLAPLPTRVMALLLIIAAAPVPTLAPILASIADVSTAEVPAALARTALLPRRVTLNCGVEEEMLVLVLPPPMPNCVVPRPPSEAIYMALLLSRIRWCAMASTTIVLVISFRSSRSATVGIAYARFLEGTRWCKVVSTCW